MTPTVGQIVHYALSEHDADTINKRRKDTSANLGAIKTDALGYVAHVGNKAEAGQVLPMVIIRVWGPSCVNGQVLLDGNDTLWKTSVSKANDYSIEQAKGTPVVGTWSYPESPGASAAVGGIVHYVSYGTPGGEYVPECRSAMITAVHDQQPVPESGVPYVDLFVMNPNGIFLNQQCRHDPGAFSETPGAPSAPSYEGGTWHWPERT